jgi:tetratricopeptide (TPR) repeat protein
MPDEIVEKMTAYCKVNKISITDENFQVIAKMALSKDEYLQCFLSDEISEKIDKLAIEGNAIFEEEKYVKAIEVFQEGLNLIPKPKENYEASLWFLVGIGDAYWFLDDYENSLTYWNQSLNVVAGNENVFVHFRKAQVLFELNKFKDAFLEFQTYKQLDEKEVLFLDEDEKYLQFFQKGSKSNSKPRKGLIPFLIKKLPKS